MSPARFGFDSLQAPRAYFSPLPNSQPVRKNEASAEERVTGGTGDEQIVNSDVTQQEDCHKRGAYCPCVTNFLTYLLPIMSTGM